MDMIFDDEDIDIAIDTARKRHAVIDNWEALKKWLIEYNEKHSQGKHDERYCVALSIEDILEKMSEIEGLK